MQWSRSKYEKTVAFTTQFVCTQLQLVIAEMHETEISETCKQIHALMLTNNVDMNLWQLSSKLIGTYACCGDLISSKLLFQETPNPNVFAFNWMILTLTFSGFHEEAIGYFSLFQESRNSNSYPNKYTFSVVLKGCVGLLDVDLGKQVHGMIYKVGFEKDVSVCNGLIDMYGKCRRICDARGVFDRMAERDVASWTTMICRYADVGRIEESVFSVRKNEVGREGLFPDLVIWNAMISGFVQSQRVVEALELFRDMLISRIKPNEVTVTGLLPVCGMVGSVGRGREIHGLIYRMGLDINVFVASALIDMYSKCGSVEEAQNVFNSIPNKNAASWNAMIGCYGKHGMVDCAIKFFDRMQDEDIQPNEVTLTAILCACSHGGLVEKGLEIFRSMDSYGVKPNKEHYSCLIDLLCRYGRMEEAYDIVKQIGVEVTDSTIGAFLNGCKIHERRDLAENISEHLRMELKKPGGFVTLSNIYASEGKWRGVQDVREVMKDKRVHKKPGFSSV
ncbi:Pentatricopeptide repeat-containing protein, chloroplastic [Sesamum angolense]|uniref:Pentatricopeptide repeat-containing protein, chloroplastic n=1 Tax=Sesamum angolense TaxID=2727404 RepID=A0AAE2C357_9LAMI|nr:Pentatricopeptide repeat-containing protein, chloroplastic [Sesamum angolense]